MRFSLAAGSASTSRRRKTRGHAGLQDALDLTRRGGGVPRRKREEKQILNKSLREVTTWSHFYFYSQFKQGIVDQYALKYFASMIGYPVLAFPFMYSRLSPAQIAARYKENNTLIQSLRIGG